VILPNSSLLQDQLVAASESQPVADPFVFDPDFPASLKKLGGVDDPWLVLPFVRSRFLIPVALILAHRVPSTAE
jgi:hypothetical protein